MVKTFRVVEKDGKPLAILQMRVISGDYSKLGFVYVFIPQ